MIDSMITVLFIVGVVCIAAGCFRPNKYHDDPMIIAILLASGLAAMIVALAFAQPVLPLAVETGR